MGQELSKEALQLMIQDLQNKLDESESLMEAIRSGEVDAFAIKRGDQSEVFTLQSGDYAYRLLIEQFGEGAVNVDIEGLIVYTNNYFSELTCMPYEKVVGSFFAGLVHPDSLSRYKHLLEEAFRGKSKGEINLLISAKVIPVYISLTSLQPALPTIGIII